MSTEPFLSLHLFLTCLAYLVHPIQIYPGSIFSRTLISSLFLDNTFTVGRLGYRNLLVDSKSTSLYIGARRNVFKLWLYNINDTTSSNLVMKHLNTWFNPSYFSLLVVNWKQKMEKEMNVFRWDTPKKTVKTGLDRCSSNPMVKFFFAPAMPWNRGFTRWMEILWSMLSTLKPSSVSVLLTKTPRQCLPSWEILKISRLFILVFVPGSRWKTI